MERAIVRECENYIYISQQYREKRKAAYVLTLFVGIVAINI